MAALSEMATAAPVKVETQTTVVETQSLKSLTIEGDESSTDSDEEEDKEEIVYLGGMQLALLVFGLCLGSFTVTLDNTIIATAIPKITSVFNSLDDVGWYGSSYLLTAAALQPSFGKIYTYFNIKWTYIFGIFLFELGSIVCATAKSSAMLITGRAIAGAGESALFSGGMTIIGFSVPSEKRPIFVAILSSVYGISSIIGPLLGGFLTDNASWRWCFWINLPVGAISIITVICFFKSPKRKCTKLTTKEKILEIDLVGAFFLICAIVCLLLALQWGGSKYEWRDSRVWGSLLGFSLLIAVFIVQQFRRGDRATIPPRIMGQKTVLFASLYSCFISMGLYVHIFYLPLYFQSVKGTTAEESGIRTVSYLGSLVIAAIIVGGAITILGWYKPFMIAGGIIFTVGGGLIYTFAVDTPTWKWLVYQFICGFGAGAGVQIPFIAVQAVLDAKDMPTGNAIAIFSNSLGGAVAISIAQNIFSNGLKTHLPLDAPGIDPRIVISAGATYLRELIPPTQLPGVLNAYMAALKQAYVISIAMGGIATICACFIEWRRCARVKKIVEKAV